MEEIITEKIEEPIEVNFGIRSYTCSEKTKRPSKVKYDLEKLEKRNSKQKRLYITLDNINEMFSNNEDKYPICYDMIFNFIQGKVTKYFKTKQYDRKKEFSYESIAKLYSILKRKLLKMQSKGVNNPTLFFYLSQFWRYVELTVYSTVHWGTLNDKYFVQEPEDFRSDEIFNNIKNYQDDEENDPFYYGHEVNIYKEDVEIEDMSLKIKSCIENNKNLSEKEKILLFKVYNDSIFNDESKLRLRDRKLLNSLKERISKDRDLLKDLEDILNAKR